MCGSGLAVAAVVVLAVACGTTEASGPPGNERPMGTLAPAVRDDFAGPVAIGDGRELFVQCRGSGSPTVVLIAGKGNSASDWSQVLDPADPIRGELLDEVGAGGGNLRDSDSAVFPAVSTFTRVCSYDRPDTRLSGTDRSTSRAQPHTVDLDVDDLHDALTAAHETGPYVLVAHSYGGFVGELYARTYPSEIAGLVLVDAASSRLGEAATPAKLAVFDQTNRLTSPQSPEGVEVLDAISKLEAAPPVPAVPSIVLSADKPYRTDLAPPGTVDATVTFTEWRGAQGLLAQSLNATHISNTNSGHHVYLYSPELVIEGIRDIVGIDRTKAPPGSR